MGTSNWYIVLYIATGGIGVFIQYLGALCIYDPLMWPLVDYGIFDNSRDAYTIFHMASTFTALTSQLIGCTFYPLMIGKTPFSFINAATGFVGLALLTVLTSFIAACVYACIMFNRSYNKNRPISPAFALQV